MKFKRVLIILGIVALIGCARGNSKTSSEPKVEFSSSTTTSSEVAESSNISSTSIVINIPSRSTGSSYSSFNTSNNLIDNKRVTVNFYNPSCGTFSTEVLNERLKAYINEVAETTLVESIINEKCQLQANIPTQGNSVLIIGASSQAGSLGFAFKDKIKAVSITAQTYHKPYTNYQTGVEDPNVDPNSILCVDGEKEGIDLRPTNGQPVEKETTFTLSNNFLRIYTKNDEKGRVFIKSMTFVY